MNKILFLIIVSLLFVSPLRADDPDLYGLISDKILNYKIDINSGRMILTGINADFENDNDFVLEGLYCTITVMLFNGDEFIDTIYEAKQFIEIYMLPFERFRKDVKLISPLYIKTKDPKNVVLSIIIHSYKKTTKEENKIKKEENNGILTFNTSLIKDYILH